MKRALIFSFLFLFVLTATAQPKTRGRVKRKYRNVERVNENLPQVIFRGLVRDVNKVPIPGASIEILGIKRLVHSNEFGQFMLSDLPTGRLRLKISCIGYRTKTIDYVLQAGYNDHYVALEKERVYLESVHSTAQKREQHIPDVPALISVVTKSFADQLNITGFDGIANLHPGFWYEEAGAGKAGFYVQGSGGNAGLTEIAPSVAVFSDEVPVIQNANISPLFFDMERVEMLNGPQNSLFGSNASGGAVNFVSTKPDDHFKGYITAGGGNFGAKEARAVVNVPVINKLLFVRAAGVFSSNDGYVVNSMGGTLNGNSSYGGRISLRFLPAINHKVDIVLNYIENNHSGMAYINPWFQEVTEDVDIFDYQASLTRGNDLGSKQVLFDGTLTYKYFINEHDYLTSVSSYRKSNSSDVWDADGTARPALEMDDEMSAQMVYQELRYNFSRKSRMNGSAGLSYNREKKIGWQRVASDDRMIYDILKSPGNFVMPAENRFPVYPQPLNPEPMADFLLTGLHQELNTNERVIQSAQAYLHFTYHLKQRLFFSGGVRAFYDRMHLINESEFSGGSESSLGEFSNSAPNILYLPSALQQLSDANLAAVGEAGLTYRWNENFNLYIKAARGRKPKVLLFTWQSQPLVVGAEKINSAEAGWKTTIRQRLFWDASGFYRRHLNVHTIHWGGTTDAGLLSANGKATSYGVQTALKAAVIKGVDVFGSYAWMQSAFDSTGVDGKEFRYAGNNFARAPEHSFTAGLTARATVMPGMQLFVNPWYSWKSYYWFTESNSSGLKQNPYGLLNLNAGVELDNPDVTISIYGTNLLEEHYLSSAGNWGGLLGMPSLIPGAPRMMGAKISWNF